MRSATRVHGPVLIIEDDEDIRDVLAALLEMAGHSTVTASNGAEALAILRDGELRPCIILLDIMMPVMNGIEFRRAQLADETLPQAPVIVLSAVAERATPDLAASAYLRKPIDFGELLREVDVHCG